MGHKAVGRWHRPPGLVAPSEGLGLSHHHPEINELDAPSRQVDAQFLRMQYGSGLGKLCMPRV